MDAFADGAAPGVLLPPPAFTPIYLPAPPPLQFPTPADYDRLEEQAAANKPPSWGNRPRRRRRAQRSPNPPGSAQLRPYPRYPRLYQPPFNEAIKYLPPEPTGNPDYDFLISTFHVRLNTAAGLRYRIYLRGCRAPRPEKKERKELETAALWSDLEEEVHGLIGVTVAIAAAGFTPPVVPPHLSVRF